MSTELEDTLGINDPFRDYFGGKKKPKPKPSPTPSPFLPSPTPTPTPQAFAKLDVPRTALVPTEIPQVSSAVVTPTKSIGLQFADAAKAKYAASLNGAWSQSQPSVPAQAGSYGAPFKPFSLDEGGDRGAAAEAIKAGRNPNDFELPSGRQLFNASGKFVNEPVTTNFDVPLGEWNQSTPAIVGHVFTPQEMGWRNQLDNQNKKQQFLSRYGYGSGYE